MEAGKKPYGRHVPHSVAGIAEYDEANYENCPYTRKYNIPWVLGEADVARYLIGQKVKKDSHLYEILSKEKTIQFSECTDSNYVRVARNDRQFMTIMFHFYNHYFIRSNNGEHIDEYIEFAVIDGEAPNIRTIYHKTIKIDQNHFANICEIKDWKQKQWILDIAKDVIA